MLCARFGCNCEISPGRKYCSISCASQDTTVMTFDDVKTYFLQRACIPDDPNACWLWIGSCNDQGYGMAFVRKQKIRAHRLAYELFVGQVPETLHVLHSQECTTRACVNYRHLRVGANYENVQDRIAVGHQPHGKFHYKSILTDDKVRNIRKYYATGQWTLEKLATKYEVDVITIHDIIKAKTWTHVDADTYVPPTDQRAVLTPEKVRHLRELREQEGLTYRQLAERFNITPTQACAICKRRSWQHVE